MARKRQSQGRAVSRGDRRVHSKGCWWQTRGKVHIHRYNYIEHQLVLAFLALSLLLDYVRTHTCLFVECAVAVIKHYNFFYLFLQCVTHCSIISLVVPRPLIAGMLNVQQQQRELSCLPSKAVTIYKQMTSNQPHI
jgi:hypothetical protein